jgi:hypothetical protein
MHCFVTFSVVGFHNWPQAPDKLAYLRDLHRHDFHIKVEWPQATDRGIEFHEMLYFCRRVMDQVGTHTGMLTVDGRDFGAKSCETIARELAGTVREHFDLDWTMAEVSEDGIVGAIVSSHKEYMTEKGGGADGTV